MIFHKLSITVTDKCNAACDMCCLSCSPKNNFHFDTSDLKAVIDEAAALNEMNEIIFTGGEALLYYKQVLECSAYAFSRGLKVSLYTNGFWGDTQENANRIVNELKNAGVTELSFSADEYHQKYIPAENLLRAIHAVNDTGLKSRLTVMEIKGSQNFAKVQELLGDEVQRTKIICHPLLLAGRAKDNFKDEQTLKLFQAKNAVCIFDNMLHLDFDGYYYMCCSIYCKDIPRLRIGKIFETPLAEFEQKVISDDFFYVMLLKGFSWYLDRAAEHGYYLQDMIAFPCECCKFIFCNPELMSVIENDVHNEAKELRERIKMRKLLTL